MIELEYFIDEKGYITKCNAVGANTHQQPVVNMIVDSVGRGTVGESGIEGVYKVLINPIVPKYIKDFPENKEKNNCPEVNLGQCYFLESENNEREYLPIIHFSQVNLNDENIVHNRYANIVDSSIWNYYVEYAINENTKTRYIKDVGNFLRILGHIADNSHRQLYNLLVSKEYVELNARLVKESYLIKIPKTGSSASKSEWSSHSMSVSPFIFHSESVVERMIKEEFLSGTPSTIQIIEKYCWRILLVDDKAVSGMGTTGNSETQEDGLPWNSKLSIIINLLKKQFKTDILFQEQGKNTLGDKHNSGILIEYVKTLEDAKTALKSNKYDIVLLDYLLEKPKKNDYGYKLLESIYNHRKDATYERGRGPGGMFFFMFISAYSTAVSERLLAEGLNQSEKYWFISVGACPTNTPQLFLYNLIKLMEKRLEDSHMNRLSINGIMDDLNLIFGETGKERINASEQYYRIQSYQYYFRSLLKDYDITVGNENLFKTNQSVLVTHFLNDHINMGGMLEHLAQLVHLTGFGTIRQWPEMWEEYLYVKVQLESLIEKGNKKQEEQLEHLCRHVENYIKKLKSSAL